MDGNRLSRRRLLQWTAGSALLGTAGLLGYRASQDVIQVGVIGTGARGKQLIKGLLSTRFYSQRANIVSLCDVYQSRAEELNNRYWLGAEVTQDHRKVLQRADIDAVVIATPDHWHAPIALEALSAGKHVYCEKPMTLTIAEGQQLVCAVEKTGLTFQVGTQQRSMARFQLACDLVRNGRVGDLKKITVSIPRNMVGGPFPAEPVPDDLDWDRWLGQAPLAEYSYDRYHKFRGFSQYSGGKITDWGAHHIDIAHWAMGQEHSAPLSLRAEGKLPTIEAGFNLPQHFKVAMQYPSGVTLNLESCERSSSIVFEGTKGRFRVNRRKIEGKPVFALAEKPFGKNDARLTRYLRSTDATVQHILHFFECIRTGEKPVSDVLSQHRSASACHLANIALRLGRPLKWDPQQEQFIADAAADTLISRVQRAPYQIQDRFNAPMIARDPEGRRAA